jgi:hypothetical protein
MIKIKTIAFLIAAASGSVGYTTAQETVDARLLKNRGAQAEESFRYNKNSYNYYLFELDNSYSIVAKSDLSGDEVNMVQPAELFKNKAGLAISGEAIVPGTFNFYDFGIKLNKDQRIYIALDKKTVLVFHSIRELTQLFISSPGNTK